MTKLKNTGFTGILAAVLTAFILNSGVANVPVFLRSKSTTGPVPVLSYFNLRQLMTNPPKPADDQLQIICPDDISVYTDIDQCTAEITSGLDVTITGGNVASLTWRMTGATKDKSPSSGVNPIGKYIFNTGVTFVDYTVTDESGKKTT